MPTPEEKFAFLLAALEVVGSDQLERVWYEIIAQKPKESAAARAIFPTAA